MSAKRSIALKFYTAQNNVEIAYKDVQDYFAQAVLQAKLEEVSVETRLEKLIEAIQHSPLENIKTQSDNGFLNCKKEVLSVFGTMIYVTQVFVGPNSQEIAKLLGVEKLPVVSEAKQGLELPHVEDTPAKGTNYLYLFCGIVRF